MIRKTITIKQVAENAGVSKQTVSRVLNNRPDVAPETRLRVQAVIDQLHYQPSNLARKLKQRGHTIGVATAQLGQYGPMRRLLGIDQAAEELGYSLHLDLVHQLETDNSEQVLNELLAWQVDGIIWAVPEISNNRTQLQDKLSQLPVPVLFVSEQSEGTLSTIAVDNRTGGRLATEHLLEQDYQHLGLITGPLTWNVARQRQLGWLDVLPTAQPKQMVEGDWSAASGERGLHQLLAHYPKLDAVFACNDQMALGVLQAAHQLDLSVPEDLGVVGFDNTPESAYFWPPLTTVRHQLIEQGKLAVQVLIGVIEAQQHNGEFAHPKITLLEPQLVVRKSSIIS